MCSTIPLAPSLEEEVEPATADFYRRVLRALDEAGVEFLVGGAFAHACFTGIRRSTKDLDLFIRRGDYDRAAQGLQAHGWRTEMTYPHWLAKVWCGEDFIDLIFNSGNGVAPVDSGWFHDNLEADVLGVPVRVANLEDSLLSSRARQRGYFEPDAVRALVDEHVSRRADHTAHIWALLMLELWFRQFVDGGVRPAGVEAAA